MEEYLRQAQMPHSSSSSTAPVGGVNSLPNGGHVRDDEQALYLLLQCGHNVEEALRRRRMQPTHATGKKVPSFITLVKFYIEIFVIYVWKKFSNF